MNSRSFLLCLLIGLTSSCKNDTSGNGLMPELATCDSAAVMYYTTPGDPRWFSLTKVYDKTSLAEIAKSVNAKTVTGKDSCISEGKIYFYGKGDAVYPVYFSRAAGCLTLSFIKTGEKYFTGMNDEVKKLLAQWQAEAKELPAAVK